MAKKAYYHRSFIILKAENRGYEYMPDRTPAGYCKFEIKRGIGKAYIFLQDIKPSSGLKGVYEAHLVSVDNMIKPCKLASLHVDERGRAEHIVSFDADDIKGSGNTLEEFHALAIVFRSGTGGNVKIAYPLIGYSGRNINMDSHSITESLKALYGADIEEVSEVGLWGRKDQSKDQSDIGSRLCIEDKSETEMSAQDRLQLDADANVDKGAEIEPDKKTEPRLWPAQESVAESKDGAESEDVAESQIGVEAETEAIPETKATPGTKTIPETGLGISQISSPTEINTRPGIEYGLDTEGTEPDKGSTSESEKFGVKVKFDPRGQITQSMPLSHVDGKGMEQGEMARGPRGESEGDKEELKKAYEDSYQRYLKDFAQGEELYPRDRTTYWENVEDYFMGLFRAHQRIFPFDEDLGDIQWVRVQQPIVGSGGYNTESFYRYPYHNYNCYDHYIVGIAKDQGETKYVVYGIPSMYSMLPPLSINGFSRWVPLKGGYGMGYWLLYIEADNGRIVYPYGKE